MRITRRKFLRFVPVSVGAIALGVAVLTKMPPAKRKVTRAFIWHKSSFGYGHLESEYAMSETMLRAGQKAADPPLMYVSKGKVKIREFAFHGV